MEKEEMKKKGLDTLGWLVAFPIQVTKKLTKRKGGKNVEMTWQRYASFYVIYIKYMCFPLLLCG